MTILINGVKAEIIDRETIISGPQHVNPTPLLCRAAVRKLALDLAKQLRPFNKFNRVSEDTLIAANEAVRQFLVNHVKRMPSKGRTL